MAAQTQVDRKILEAYWAELHELTDVQLAEEAEPLVAKPEWKLEAIAQEYEARYAQDAEPTARTADGRIMRPGDDVWMTTTKMRKAALVKVVWIDEIDDRPDSVEVEFASGATEVLGYEDAVWVLS